MLVKNNIQGKNSRFFVYTCFSFYTLNCFVLLAIAIYLKIFLCHGKILLVLLIYLAIVAMF